MDDEDWLTTAQACAVLGVKPQTLYAYVSRGQLFRRIAADGRSSRFRRGDVEGLMRRSASRGRQGRVDVVVDTELTLLEPAGRLYYRGEDAVDLARTRSFEEVAEWLWTGAWGPGPWDPWPAHLAAVHSLAPLVPAGARPVERLRLAVPAMSLAQSSAGSRSGERSAVVETARSLLPALVEVLPTGRTGTRRAPPSEMAARLWPKLCPRPASSGELGALRAALVLLADHELPASTLAARIAASVRGDIYLVLGAALGSLGGPLHGGASLLVEDFLRSLPDVATAVSVVDHRIAEGDRVPGFGHAVYLDRDPRADCLLDVAGTVLARSPTWSIVEAVRGAMQRHGGPAPNIDFALGALAVCSGMGRGAGEAVFAVARCAGWVAHALEEYGRRSQFRLRAIYTGVRPR